MTSSGCAMLIPPANRMRALRSLSKGCDTPFSERIGSSASHSQSLSHSFSSDRSKGSSLGGTQICKCCSSYASSNLAALAYVRGLVLKVPSIGCLATAMVRDGRSGVTIVAPDRSQYVEGRAA